MLSPSLGLSPNPTPAQIMRHNQSSSAIEVTAVPAVRYGGQFIVAARKQAT